MSPRITQRQRIFDLLKAHEGAWVAAWKLSRISLQFGARILELRRQGRDIQNRIEKKAGDVHSSYRLVVPKPLVRTQPPQPYSAPTLFTEKELRVPTDARNYPD